MRNGRRRATKEKEREKAKKNGKETNNGRGPKKETKGEKRQGEKAQGAKTDAGFQVEFQFHAGPVLTVKSSNGGLCQVADKETDNVAGGRDSLRVLAGSLHERAERAHRKRERNRCLLCSFEKERSEGKKRTGEQSSRRHRWNASDVIKGSDRWWSTADDSQRLCPVE